MQFTHEHNELKRNLKRFIDNEINPFVDEWEEAEIFPAKELFRKMGQQGFLGVSKPAEYGGLALDYSYSVAMAETLGHIKCGGVPMAIGVQTDMATPALARFGSDALRAEFLAPAIQGEMVACVGVSEPGAGSDVASIRTTARKDGDDYVINGSKMWITNSLQADWICLLANTSDGGRYSNKSLIVVPLKTRGISVAKKIKKIGMNSSDTGLLYFDEVRVPQRYRIGEEGQGFIYQMLQFQEERMWGAANATQAMFNCIDMTIEYARERKVFDMPLIDNQWVHFKLAELKTEVESLRALVYRACELYIGGQDVTELASMAKLKAGRLARTVPDACLQFWGGMGYTWENPVSRFYRDGRLTSIGGGADEIMLGIISKYMGILPGKKKSAQ
ncbi:acyl-CoA dehydrogenase family protein [Noviherbaspirillum autotrophicum]|uniref:Acyl-CoA dehydrogenase n=1 Tax=Noviherbaspirillum autotrophicum TaxID=709839 RepID=A0A0C2BT89_9BURK|nr:acyl-CoA dehydrogenase family protein [Noviherbaspirillum autotrophicum]KIF83259.1 acyl-CoA dehydrogenase [Noviherbaspirillum autotrophicum]